MTFFPPTINNETCVVLWSSVICFPAAKACNPTLLDLTTLASSFLHPHKSLQPACCSLAFASLAFCLHLKTSRYIVSLTHSIAAYFHSSRSSSNFKLKYQGLVCGRRKRHKRQKAIQCLDLLFSFCCRRCCCFMRPFHTFLHLTSQSACPFPHLYFHQVKKRESTLPLYTF